MALSVATRGRAAGRPRSFNHRPVFQLCDLYRLNAGPAEGIIKWGGGGADSTHMTAIKI